MIVSDQFPVGLKVLVVDDDIPCLRILEKMLHRCMYNVTTCSQATVALNLLRERKGSFDVILSDVHMPDMDGFRLLELVGLEMDLPVIMMSADGRTSAVMRGISRGACDYLIKPIREEELKNIWQHVVRKKWNESKEHEHSGSVDDNDRNKRGTDEAEYASSVNGGMEGMLKTQTNRRDAEDEDDCELENDDPATTKKQRVVWSEELHQQFVVAVNQLGIDKAVPKRILELMNVPGLTRENVASHLQKLRLYLKRLSGLAQQQGGIPNLFCGSLEQNPKLGSLGRFDINTMAASGQIPPQTLTALHAEILGRPTGNLVLPARDQPDILQASLQGSECIAIDNDVAYGQPLMKCPSDMSKHFPQPMISTEYVHSGFGAWPSSSLGTVGSSSNRGGLNAQNSNVLMAILQHQQQQQCQQQQQQQHHHRHHPQQKQSILLEPSRSINVQPSCLVVPSLSSACFQAGNSPASFNQNCNFNRSSVIDYGLLSPQSSSFCFGQMPDRDLKTTGLLDGYSGPSSTSPSVSPSLVNAENGAGSQENSTPTCSAGRLLPGLVPSMSDIQGFYSAKAIQGFDQGPLRNLGFVGQGTSIPSRFAVDEPESQISNLNYGICVKNMGNKMKQEPNMNFIENAIGHSNVTTFFK